MKARLKELRGAPDDLHLDLGFGDRRTFTLGRCGDGVTSDARHNHLGAPRLTPAGRFQQRGDHGRRCTDDDRDLGADRSRALHYNRTSRHELGVRARR